MIDSYFILHLSLIDGVGPVTIQKIRDIMRSGVQTSDLYLFSSADFIRYGKISCATADKIVAGLSNKQVLETELQLIDRHQISWTTIHDEGYPALLREIYLPPAVLYWRGGTFNDVQKHIAIVGARACNSYGHRVISTIVPELVQAGFAVVSGGALGIDTIAHGSAVAAGGKTIVVLGSGLLKPYPLANDSLFNKIVHSGGMIVSAFPLLAEPLPKNFPARNRIIAGLSHGCLVVQAAQKSGSLITAHYALEQGRELFAIPGSVDDPLSSGCHSLIQKGAKLVACATDIVEEYGMAISKAIARDVQTTLHDAQQLIKKDLPAYKAEYQHYTPDQSAIIAACCQSVSLDDIATTTGLEMAFVQSELFNLQLEGIVVQDFIGMWIVAK